MTDMTIKKREILDLFIISFLALYFEILFIRWVPACVRPFGYFTNLILISAFLGLGLGCLLNKIKFDFMNIFFPTVLIFTVLLFAFSGREWDNTIFQTESFLGLGFAAGTSVLLIILITFIFNTLLFIPLGQRLGRALTHFRPLVAYSVNLLGSIIGIVAFSLLSLWANPFIWVCVGLVITFWFFKESIKQVIIQGAIVVLLLFVVFNMHPHSYWSPYYKIDIRGVVMGQINETEPIYSYRVTVNDRYHQYLMDLRDETGATSIFPAQMKKYYEMPYTLFNPEKVLILGAGGGNDAAAALRMGVEDVVGVEIDPFIADLGRRLHPEKPYLSDHVRLYIDDARSYVRKSQELFDLIVIGFLDAHNVLSQFSSVRLDNYIYTKESFQDIKKHLSRDGVFQLGFAYYNPKHWMTSKMLASLKAVFGDDVRSYRLSTHPTTYSAMIFLCGPGIHKLAKVNENVYEPNDGLVPGGDIPTDDWPYLYLKNKHFPNHYIIIISLIILFAFLSFYSIGSAPLRLFNPHFFFLGAGFMLLETVSITRYALLFVSFNTRQSPSLRYSRISKKCLCLNLVDCLWHTKSRALSLRSDGRLAIRVLGYL